MIWHASGYRDESVRTAESPDTVRQAIEWRRRALEAEWTTVDAVVLIGVGAGIYLFFTSVGAPQARFFGAIPGFIGVALLVNALFTALLPPKNPRSSDRTSQS